MSDSVRPHRCQPTRLPLPWDSPGKNTGVGCHFLLQCMKVKVKSPSHVRLLAIPWTAAYQAPPSMGFSRQEYWSGVLHASNLHGSSILHMVIYMFQCSSLKSSHLHLLPQNPKDCSLHLYLFCCLAYRVIVIIFLNSIYIVNIPYWCFSF